MGLHHSYQNAFVGCAVCRLRCAAARTGKRTVQLGRPCQHTGMQPACIAAASSCSSSQHCSFCLSVCFDSSTRGIWLTGCTAFFAGMTGKSVHMHILGRWRGADIPAATQQCCALQRQRYVSNVQCQLGCCLCNTGLHSLAADLSMFIQGEHCASCASRARTCHCTCQDSSICWQVAPTC